MTDGPCAELAEFDEFAAAMRVPDQGVNLAADEVDSGQQAHRAVSFDSRAEVACTLGSGVSQSGGCDRLYYRLLALGDDRHCFARRLFRRGGRLPQTLVADR